MTPQEFANPFIVSSTNVEEISAIGTLASRPIPIKSCLSRSDAQPRNAKVLHSRVP